MKNGSLNGIEGGTQRVYWQRSSFSKKGVFEVQ